LMRRLQFSARMATYIHRKGLRYQPASSKMLRSLFGSLCGGNATYCSIRYYASSKIFA